MAYLIKPELADYEPLHEGVNPLVAFRFLGTEHTTEGSTEHGVAPLNLFKTFLDNPDYDTCRTILSYPARKDCVLAEAIQRPEYLINTSQSDMTCERAWTRPDLIEKLREGYHFLPIEKYIRQVKAVYNMTGECLAFDAVLYVFPHDEETQAKLLEHYDFLGYESKNILRDKLQQLKDSTGEWPLPVPFWPENPENYAIAMNLAQQVAGISKSDNEKFEKIEVASFFLVAMTDMDSQLGVDSTSVRHSVLKEDHAQAEKIEQALQNYLLYRNLQSNIDNCESNIKRKTKI